MVATILALLAILFLLGYVKIPFLSFAFQFGSLVITLREILVFFLILWLIDLLPRPFREISILLFILWILSAVGVIAIAGFGNIVLIALLVGVGISLLKGKN